MGLLAVIGGIVVSIFLAIGVVRAVDHITNNQQTKSKRKK